MMNRKRIVPFLALVTVLGSCSQLESSSSSSAPSSVLPIQLYDNYRREGSFQIALDVSGFGAAMQRSIYHSPISLDYQADEKQGYGPNASFEIRPFEVTGTDEERLVQANRNQEVLHALFSMTSRLLSGLDQDAGMLPVLADRYSDDFSSVTELPDETFAFQSVDSLTYVVDTTKEGEKDVLRFLAAQSDDEDSGWNLDLSNVTIDVPALLHYLTDFLPGEAVLRPIFSTVGDVVEFLANSLSLKIAPLSDEETQITLFINDTGRKELVQSIGDALGLALFDDATLNELSLTVTLFDDATLRNQLEDCRIRFDMTASTFDIALSIDAHLDKAHEILPEQRFENFADDMISKRAIFDEVQPFYVAVKDVIPWQDTLLTEAEVDFGKVDLAQNAVSEMERQAQDYFSLSADGKNLLGDRFLSATTAESLANILLSSHREGVEKIQQLKDRYIEFDKEIGDDNYIDIFEDVSQYLHWEQGLMDYDAGEEKEAFDRYREDRFGRAQQAIQASKQTFQAFVDSPEEEALESALASYREIEELLSIAEQYLSVDFQGQKEELVQAFQTQASVLPASYHEYFASVLPNLDYSGLAELASSQAVTSGGFYSIDLLSESERASIRKLLEQEGLRLKKRLLDSASSVSSLQQQFLGDQADLLTLEQTERNLLATDVYASEYRSLKVELEKILQS